MTRFIPRLRTRAFAAMAASAALGATLLVGSSSAIAHNYYRAVPAPPAVPTRADQIQNIDQVKTAIKGYYGDTTTTQVDPVPNSVDGKDFVLHQFSPTSNYASELGGIVNSAERFLSHPRGKGTHPGGSGKKAVLFDVDDTTLNTYSYEIYSNFVYNPTTNAAFVDNPTFDLPAVPHMVNLEHYAVSHGYTVFYLTGRPVAQLGGTIQDLQAAGYQFDAGNVYTKDPKAPWLSSCSNGTTVSCTTSQYKSLTREHIESLGFDIVANFGDQYSDLTGGFADRTFKLPNPMYYLP